MGLFSLLDAIMSRPIDEILEEITVEKDIVEALTGEGNELKKVLDLVIAMEKGQWDQVSALSTQLQLDEQPLPVAYMDAVKWAQEIYAL